MTLEALFLFLAVGSSLFGSQADFAGQETLSIPSLEEIKNSLFVALNEERSARNLPLLKPSPALDRVARGQSEDMARLGLLTHASATGQTYADRLFSAKIYYRAIGENVAQSGTFLPSIIHHTLMNSPDHRENILDPLFDEVGIAVVRTPDRMYYVTQDFVRSLVPRPEAEIREILLRGIEGVRARMGLPPFEWLGEIDDSARNYARSRAAGNILKTVPEAFKGCQVSFTNGPDLGEIADLLGKKSAAPFARGGLGFWFDRTPEYPGGAYYVCAILLPADRYAGLKSKSLAALVLRAANALRAEKRLRPFSPNEGLERLAAAVYHRYIRKGGRGSATQATAFETVFETPELESFPASLVPSLEDPSYQKIGITVTPVADKWGLIDRFVVALVLDRS